MADLYVVETGTGNPGPLVVLVHGSMDRSASWIRVVRELRDLHTARYDRRGYGRSRSLGPGTMAAHVGDLVDIIGDRSCVVAGHSYGAAVALAAAQVRPDVVRAVVAFEGPMSWRDWWPRGSAGGRAVEQVEAGAAAAEAAERFLRRMIGDDRWDALPARTRADRRAEGEALVTELVSARRGGAPYDPARIAVPVISARGTESEAHLQRSADVLAAEVGTAELAVIEGAGHGAHMSHPAAFAALIRRSIDAARRTPAR